MIIDFQAATLLSNLGNKDLDHMVRRNKHLRQQMSLNNLQFHHHQLCLKTRRLLRSRLIQ
jgi:hypothetical protein